MIESSHQLMGSSSELRKQLASLTVPVSNLAPTLGVAALLSHKELKSIELTETQVTGIGIGSLQGLESLELTNTNLVDEAFAEIGKLPKRSEVPVADAMRFSRHDSCALLIQDPKNERENRSFQTNFGCMGSGPVYVTSSELASMSGEAVGNNADELVLEGLVGLSAKHFENFGCDITSLSLARSTVHSDLFSYLRNWPLLVDLDVTRSSTTNADLEAIGKLRNLRSLELGETAIDDLGMLKIQSLTNLTKLSLDKTNVTPVSFKLIKRFKLLESLSLPFALDASSLIELLEACPSLRSLECVSTGTDARQEIVAFDSLKLHDIEFTVEQLRRLLDLHMQRATDNSSIACQTLSDRHCEVLANYIEIGELDLSHSLVTDVGIAYIAKLPILRTLNISDTDVTAAGLRSLQANQKLGTLIYSPQTWTAESVAALLELREIMELSLPFSNLPRDVALALASGLNSKGLTWYEGGPEFSEQFYYTDEDIAWMAGKQPFNPNSAQLTLFGPLIDDAKLAEVTSSSAVEYVHVKNVHCDIDVLLEKVLACRSTKHVSLSGIQLSPSDIGKLGQLKQLEFLNVENCELTNAHIAELATLKNLSTLMISCKIAESNGLIELTKLSRLRQLTLRTNGPMEKYEELRQRLGKRCEIVGRVR